jgi:hypothetical protein
MSVSQSPIWVVDGATGQAIEAVLFDAILERHLRDFEHRWRPWLQRAVASAPELPAQQSAHWDWRQKVRAVGGLLGFPSFAIECGGETQGLMIASTVESCRLETQIGKPLVYVEFLETAPWNRTTLTGKPRYHRVGPAMIDVAIQLSTHEGFQGRTGLHALPQSDDWYRNKCKMTDMGRDPKKQNLRYFEMTREQADAFLRRGE